MSFSTNTMDLRDAIGGSLIISECWLPFNSPRAILRGVYWQLGPRRHPHPRPCLNSRRIEAFYSDRNNNSSSDNRNK